MPVDDVHEARLAGVGETEDQGPVTWRINKVNTGFFRAFIRALKMPVRALPSCFPLEPIQDF